MNRLLLTGEPRSISKRGAPLVHQLSRPVNICPLAPRQKRMLQSLASKFNLLQRWKSFGERHPLCDENRRKRQSTQLPSEEKLQNLHARIRAAWHAGSYPVSACCSNGQCLCHWQMRTDLSDVLLPGCRLMCSP